MNDRLRETDALIEENNTIAHELEVYGAEDEPRVNAHKHLFRLAAALLRRNATTIERQGKALRAVAELCDEYEATYDLRPALDALERGNGEEEDMAADYVMLAEIVRVLRAALAQTEPQTADDGEPYVSLAGTALQRFKENPLRDDRK